MCYTIRAKGSGINLPVVGIGGRSPSQHELKPWQAIAPVNAERYGHILGPLDKVVPCESKESHYFNGGRMSSVDGRIRDVHYTIREFMDENGINREAIGLPKADYGRYLDAYWKERGV